MKQRIILMLVATAFAAIPSGVAAQRIDSPYRFLDHGQFVGAYAGYMSAEEGVLGIGPKSGGIFGATWGLRVSGPFAVGVDVGFLPTTRTVRDTVFVAADSMYREIGEADVALLTVLGNIRLNLTGARTWNGFQPFVLLGGGAALDLGSESEAESTLDSTARYDFGTSFAGLLGAGVDWFPTSRVSLKLDARSVFWKLNVPDAFRLTENGRTLDSSEWERNVALTAGLSFHF